MQIWPAIDIRGGKCVRLMQGDYAKERVYGESPADMAARWVSDGATCLHLVDLDGARDGSNANREAIAKIMQTVDVPCELGGGIRDEQTIADYLALGVNRLVIGTKALKEPEWFALMCEKYPNRLAVGIDARSGQVATNGWLETSDVSATALARSIAKQPIAALIYTDIATDGMLCGPNLSAMQEMNEAVDVPVVASGGITSPEDVSNLAKLGMSACIIGRSLYEGRLTLADATRAASVSAD